ncbi:hypothetical protein NPIL_576741 [Nephila pilipes]|uniref:Uncharacterized protein n=1 Tax=Nephila pilipes TaxID=299642 RepID=A0A8X6MWY9_NEPPI|nr:hypothetical protein NPIL_576741 [Nephila pilipes]
MTTVFKVTPLFIIGKPSSTNASYVSVKTNQGLQGGHVFIFHSWFSAFRERYKEKQNAFVKSVSVRITAVKLVELCVTPFDSIAFRLRHVLRAH